MRDAVQIVHDLIVRKSNHAISFLRNIGIATRVAGDCRVANMGVTVDFDDQPPVMTDEIAVEWAEPLLLTEFVLIESAIAQDRPQRRFRRSAIAAQLPGAGYAAIITGEPGSSH